MAFPTKTSVFGRFSSLPLRTPPPPSKRKYYFYCRLAVSENQRCRTKIALHPPQIKVSHLSPDPPVALSSRSQQAGAKGGVSRQAGRGYRGTFGFRKLIALQGGVAATVTPVALDRERRGATVVVYALSSPATPRVAAVNELFQWNAWRIFDPTEIPPPPLSRDRCSNTPCRTVFPVVSQTIAATPPRLSSKMADRKPKTGLTRGVSQQRLASEAYRAIGGGRAK